MRYPNQKIFDNGKDLALHISRGVVMIYIVCVIHLLYWTNFFTNDILKGLFLIEMPAIFFISGFSYIYSKSKKNYFSFLIGRFSRIVVPYFIFVIVMAAIFLLFNICVKKHFDLSSGFWFKSFLFQFPYSSAIWFIKVYIIIICLSPVLVWIYNKIGLVPIFFIVLCVLFGLEYTTLEFPYYYVCYGFFFIVGYDFGKNRRTCPKILHYPLIASISLAVLIWCFYAGFDLDLQKNKFPPNIMFFCYGCLFGLFAVCALYSNALSLYRTKIVKWLIDVYSKYGYDIFMFQIISFFPFKSFAEKLLIGQSYDYTNISLPMTLLLVVVSFLYLLFFNAAFILAYEYVLARLVSILRSLYRSPLKK